MARRCLAAPTADLDLDATLLVAHTDRKQGAAGSYKHTFGFHPLLAYLDRGDGRGEALAGILRPGNATANDATDHIAVLRLALVQLPAGAAKRLLVRTDSAGASQAFLAELRACKLQFSIGLPIDAHVRDVLLALPQTAWLPAIDPDGHPRDGAWVAEATGWLDFSGYPPGTRAICRRERPHPGANVRFTDAHGRRYQVFVTDQPDRNLARLELRHRPRRRPHPRRQGHRPGQPSLRCLATQRGVAGTRPGCPGPDLLAPDPAAGRRVGHRRAQAASHSPAAYRRPLADPGPTADPVPASPWPWATVLAAAFTRLWRLLPTPG